MFHPFACKNYYIIRTSNLINTDSKPPFPQNPSSLSVKTRLIICSSVSNPDFTVDYLTNSCGLSQESALKVSKHIILKSTTRPDSVLSLLISYGITKPQISKIIRFRPQVLLMDPDKRLKPKLEFFSNMDMSGHAFANLVSKCPGILTTSLEKKIIPSITYLRSLVGTENGIAVILKKSWWVLADAEGVMGSSIAVLQDHGAPQSNISKMLMLYPQILYKKSDLIKENVLLLLSMGFCPSSMMFLHGLNVLVGMKKSTWDKKMAAYKSFGWSEDEVLFAFKKHPFFMSVSVKKISLGLDFLIYSLKWTREDIARNPSVMSLSFRKRVIPRCHVLQKLLSKKLISKTSIGQALRVTEYVFLEKYVSKYCNEIPVLLEMYQSMKVTQRLLIEAKHGC